MGSSHLSLQSEYLFLICILTCIGFFASPRAGMGPHMREGVKA